VVKVI